MVNRTQGFTLIEVMIALLIIGMAMSMILPLLLRQRPGVERDQFIDNVRALVTLAWQQALVSRKMHRIVFNLTDRSARVERQEEKAGKTDFVPLKGLMVPTSMKWSRDLEIKQFFVNGSDQMSRFAGARVRELWFYSMPDGMMQQVTIKALDKSGGRRQKPQQFDLIVNPFTAQLKVEYA